MQMSCLRLLSGKRLAAVIVAFSVLVSLEHVRGTSTDFVQYAKRGTLCVEGSFMCKWLASDSSRL